MAQTATSENLVLTATFSVEIDGVQLAFFKSCSGLSTENQVVEHKVVNTKGQLITQKVPGHAKYADIVLKKSLDGGTALADWRKQVVAGQYTDYRRNGSIVLIDSMGTEVARWNFTAGWPSTWKGSDLDAGADDIAIEEVTIAHEGLEPA